MGLFDRIAPRRPEPEPPPVVAAAPVEDPSFATKALPKFMKWLGPPRQSPVLLDLSPVVGSNVDYFGRQLGCKIFIEDLFADVERHHKANKAQALAAFFKTRFRQADASVDGILCWDLIDYLDRPAAEELARQLVRMLKPEGALLGFFGTAQSREVHYTKYIIVDEATLKYRPYGASRGRQAVLQNRDIIRMFTGAQVSDSFLLQNNVREILFRKPA